MNVKMPMVAARSCACTEVEAKLPVHVHMEIWLQMEPVVSVSLFCLIIFYFLLAVDLNCISTEN